MNLKDILAISGQPGLFKFIAPGTNGIIVESLTETKRQNVPASSKVSSLAEIAIYTDDEEKPLAEIFQTLFDKNSGGQTISHKSENEKLKALFAEILPDYDRDRVHVSDMKKIVSWYNLLVDCGMTDFSLPEEAEADEPESEEKESE